MKKLGILVAFIAIFMTGFIYKEPVVTYAKNLAYISPCEEPRTYRIGSIDPKYNLNKYEFISKIQSASDIWSDHYGKNLFIYDAKGDIEINLVYDQRSFLSTKINDLNSQVKARQKELDPEIESYKNKTSQFRSKVTQLNNDIEYWNTKGGAPPEEYEKLKSRQAALRQEGEALAAEAARLNQTTEEFNSQVGQLHNTIENFNEELSYKPEEGEYIYDNGKETINIYFDNSETELIHTLAHEFGHALGIEHNNNPLSIMHPKTNERIELSVDDLEGLQKACEKKNIVELGVQKFSLVINKISSDLAEKSNK
jgi:peptidoglycan hydrolase CwlO-like protein